MKINTDATKREQAHNSRPTEGPLSKDNYDRFNNAMRGSVGIVGVRRVSKFTHERIVNEIIMEDPNKEEEEEENRPPLAEVDNPLISAEQIKIIEAAIPKYTMQ